jgi:hypothetical protein
MTALERESHVHPASCSDSVKKEILFSVEDEGINMDLVLPGGITLQSILAISEVTYCIEYNNVQVEPLQTVEMMICKVFFL